MKVFLSAVAAAMIVSGPVLAEGDAAAGEDVFKKCRSCHMVETAEGETIQKGGKTGPNLWGIAGRTAGTSEDFTKFSASMVAAGEAGLVWDEETFVAYVQDPTGFLKTYLSDDKAKGKMTFKLKDGMADVWAYLVSVGPEAPATN